MEIETTYTVYYMAENMFGTLSQDTLYFDTEKEADKFIQDLLNDESKRVWKVVKTAQTIYYPKAEKK